MSTAPLTDESVIVVGAGIGGLAAAAGLADQAVGDSLCERISLDR